MIRLCVLSFLGESLKCSIMPVTAHEPVKLIQSCQRIDFSFFLDFTVPLCFLKSYKIEDTLEPMFPNLITLVLRLSSKEEASKEKN